MLGVLFITVLRNGMILLGVNPILFMFGRRGLVIMLAVWWSMLRRGQNKDGGLE